MSMTEVVGRIGTIQAMIAQVSRPIETKAASPAPAAAASAAAFGAALAAAGVATGAAVNSASGSVAGLDLPRLAGVGAPGINTGAPGIEGALATGAAALQSGTVTGGAVAATAKKYIGIPYVWGGTNPATGLDCSGFVQRVFKDLGVDVPRVVSDQMKVGTPVASLAEAKAGDLLVSFGGNHISIYLGNGKAIDAPVPGQTIQIRDAWEQQSNLTSIRRIVPASRGI